MKKTLSLLVIGAGLITSLVGCGSKKEYQIGILQVQTHGALNDAREGFIDAINQSSLKDKVDFNYQNPEGDSIAMTAMAKDLVRKNNLVLGVATPAASALKAASIEEDLNLPILFTAVTDPVDAKLVASNEHPGANITGTNDMNPVEEQIQLIKELVPNIQKIGILYTISETNSKVQADLAAAEVTRVGLNSLTQTVVDATDIASTTRKLISDGAEAIYIPTDNNLAKNMPSVANVANEAKIPVICGEGNMVEAGGLITLGIDYYELGKLTGEMAIDILVNNLDPKGMAVQSLPSESYLVTINQDTVETLGIEIPQSILDRVNN